MVAHLEAHAPWGAQVTVTPGRTVAAVRCSDFGPAYAAAGAAFAEAWGTAPVEIGVGGSIGFVGPFAQAFPDAEILITGVEDPDTRAHGANESLHLADFERACLAEALLRCTTWATRRDWTSPASPARTELVEVLRQHLPPGPPIVFPLRAPRVDPVGNALATEDVGGVPGLSDVLPGALPEARIARRCRNVSSCVPSRSGGNGAGTRSRDRR